MLVSLVIRSTSPTSASVASGAPRMRFSRRLPESTGASCSTYPMAARSSGMGQSRRSVPSSRIRPASGS